jgi:hypothetical protein
MWYEIRGTEYKCLVKIVQLLIAFFLFFLWGFKKNRTIKEINKETIWQKRRVD